MTKKVTVVKIRQKLGSIECPEQPSTISAIPRWLIICIWMPVIRTQYRLQSVLAWVFAPEQPRSNQVNGDPIWAPLSIALHSFQGPIVIRGGVEVCHLTVFELDEHWSAGFFCRSEVIGILSALVKQWPVTCELQKKPAKHWFRITYLLL